MVHATDGMPFNEPHSRLDQNDTIRVRMELIDIYDDNQPSNARVDSTKTLHRPLD